MPSTSRLACSERVGPISAVASPCHMLAASRCSRIPFVSSNRTPTTSAFPTWGFRAMVGEQSLLVHDAQQGGLDTGDFTSAFGKLNAASIHGPPSLSGVAVPAFDPFENRHTIAKQAKRILRKQMRGVRGTQPYTVLARHAEIIQDRLIHLPPFAEAKRVALCSVPSGQRGVDTALLAQQARTLGKIVAYPRVDFDAQSVTFHAARETELESRGLETAEAPASASIVPPDTIELLVVPVLAVDPTGGFIGDGSGIYDHVLQHMAHATTVAVAFDFQLIPEAPRTSNDVRVAVVVTEERVLEARGERGDEGVTHRTSSTDRAVKEVRRAKQPDTLVGPIARTDVGDGRTRRCVGKRA